MKPSIVTCICISFFIGVLPGKLFSQPDFKDLPVLRWKFHSNNAIISSPVINEGLAYFGGLDSVLYALEINTGSVKWKLHTGGEIRSTALVYNNFLFLVAGDGVFYCIDKNSGKKIWSKIFNKTAFFLGERKYDIADYYHSAAVVYNHCVYFGAGDGKLYAMDIDTGDIQWTFATGDIIHATPVIYKDKIYCGSFDGYLYALNANSGSLLWKFKSVGHDNFPKGEIQGSPVAFNGMVFVGSRDYNLYALDANSGYAHWNQKYPKGWALANAVKDSVLYTGTSDDKVMIAMEPATGKELWRTNVAFNIFGPSVFSSSMLYCGTLQGKFFGMDRKTGAIFWTFHTDGYQNNHDTYFKQDGTFRDDISHLIHNNVEYINAQLQWGAIFSSPAISNDVLIITSTDGNVYCLQRANTGARNP